MIDEFGLLDAPPRRGGVRKPAVSLWISAITPEALINNTNLLGIDPGGLDALLLDAMVTTIHFGGLAAASPLRANNGKWLKAKLPIYIGGEEAILFPNGWTAPPMRWRLPRARSQSHRRCPIYR